ncbi:MAG: ABC transporter substrate-binding protein [Candidatus Hydrogenedentes bacterium]|nr:ABC transporter substrate-binding protein [Candidatus Hydrogenedentota bacterium]
MRTLVGNHGWATIAAPGNTGNVADFLVCRLIGSIFICFSAILSGCHAPLSANNSSRVEITYWRTLTGAAGEGQEELVRRFNNSQNEIHVHCEFQGSYSDLAAKLFTAAAAGAGPDVTQLGTFEILQFARAGLLVDLKPYFAGPEAINTKDWPGTISTAGEVEDGLYWLPFNVTVPVLYYNEDAFNAAGLLGPPTTWDDFYLYARKLTVRDDNGVVREAGVALWNITWPLISAIWSEGGKLTTRDYGHITLDDPVVLKVMTEFQTLVREGAALLPDEASGGHRAAFKNGRAAMILDSPAAFQEIFAQAIGFTPMVAAYPAGKNGKVYAPGGGGLVLWAKNPATNRAAAWRFLRFMLSAESLAYYSQQTGYAAFTESAQQVMTNDLKDSRFGVIHDGLRFVRGDFSINMSPSVRNAFDEAFQKIMVDLADVKTTLMEADAKAEHAIAERGI